ncbi:small GTP-binding protein [Histomonas meleagridis]|uniref:small GTP-binding protein n=1 Tax=Histomonas meleagridis TaxID=135588 RepID=UPI003559B1B8|nr:small GTP-binding protein [Histomonas meleagridis]KAH0798477.1 small GTP-binding protein [Histomonas meleagridis]
MQGNIPTLKVAFIGDSGVGKSAIITRFVNGVFAQALLPNVAGDHYEKVMNVGGQIINIQIWDTAGQEQYKSIAPFYYRNAHAIIIVFAVGNRKPQNLIARDSLNSVSDWYDQIREHNRDAIVVLVGNMTDLENREISYDEGELKAHTLPDVIEYFETSALQGDGIDNVFQFLAERFLDTQVFNPEPEPEPETKPVVITEADQGGGCCC